MATAAATPAGPPLEVDAGTLAVLGELGRAETLSATEFRTILAAAASAFAEARARGGAWRAPGSRAGASGVGFTGMGRVAGVQWLAPRPSASSPSFFLPRTGSSSTSSASSSAEGDERVRVHAAAAALETLFALATRSGCGGGDVRRVVEAAGLNATRSAAVEQAFEEARGPIAAALETLAVPLDRIVDLDWRLSFLRRSTVAGKVDEPLYVLQLHLESPDGTPSTREFTCTQQQLQDLLARVRDATDAVDTLLGVGPGAATAGAAGSGARGARRA